MHQLPEKARADAYHIALATWHGIDFMVSWNCTHIVNGKITLLPNTGVARDIVVGVQSGSVRTSPLLAQS